MVHARSFLVVALAAGLPIFACATSTVTETDAGVPSPDGGGAQVTPTQARSDVREAWLAEAQWARFYAISAQAAERTTALSHLNASEDAIAANVGTYAGEAAQTELAALLHQRAQLWVNFLSPAAVRGSSAESALLANAATIAQFFGRLGSAWDANAIRTELDAQLQAMIDGLRMRGDGDAIHWASAFDIADQHTLAVADNVAAGLVKQYPSGFAPATTKQTDDDFRLKMRVALDEHAFWMRVFAIDRMANRDAQPALDRAANADNDFGKLFEQFYGEAVGGQAQYQIHTDEIDATAFIFAIELGDPAAVDGTSKQWDQDAEKLAQFLVSTTPALNLADPERMTQVNADRERAMITARFASQWDADAANYEMVVVNIDSLGDSVATTITTSSAQPR